MTINDNDTAGSITPAPDDLRLRLTARRGAGQRLSAKGTGLVLLNGPETSAQVGMIFQNLGSPNCGPCMDHRIPVAAIIFPLPSTDPVINFVCGPAAQQVADLKASTHYPTCTVTTSPTARYAGSCAGTRLEELLCAPAVSGLSQSRW